MGKWELTWAKFVSFPVAIPARKSRKTRENPAPYIDIMQFQRNSNCGTVKWEFQKLVGEIDSEHEMGSERGGWIGNINLVGIVRDLFIETFGNWDFWFLKGKNYGNANGGFSVEILFCWVKHEAHRWDWRNVFWFYC